MHDDPEMIDVTNIQTPSATPIVHIVDDSELQMA
jgi:hypothetical protein